jgi:foldase protein PrsA
VAAYYDGHHEQFTRPERRDFRLLRTRTRAAAAAARRALERGQTWRQVGRRLGIDWVSVSGGRKQLGIARGTLGPTLDPVIFGAPLNRLRGPLKTSFGYLVYKVLEVTPPERRTLAQASEEIARQLAGERGRAARDAFFDAMQVKWKARTTCRSGYLIELCAT